MQEGNVVGHRAIADALQEASMAVRQLDSNAVYQQLANFPVARNEESFGQGWFVHLRFETGAELFAALEAGDPTVVTFALQFLAAFEPSRAVQLALPLVGLAASALPGRFDSYAVGSAAQVLDEQVHLLSLADALDLGRKGTLEVDLGARLLDHPELADTAQRRALFAEIGRGTHGDAPFITAIEQQLALALLPNEPAAVQWVVARWHEADHPSRDLLFNWLVNAGCADAIAGIAEEAEPLLRNAMAPPHQRDGVVRALLMTDPDRAAELLSSLVLNNAHVPQLEKDALLNYKLRDALYSGAVAKNHPGWIAVLVESLGRPGLSQVAKEVLSTMDKKSVKKALAAAGVTAPSRPPERLPPLPKKIDFLKRYRGGEHERVWSELGALFATVRDQAVEVEARAVAIETMTRVYSGLEQIVQALKKSKYNFSARRPLLAAKKTSAKQLAAIEKLIGGPLPLSIHAFYTVFEQVDLREAPTAMVDDYTLHEEVGRSNPLVIVPLKQVLADLRVQARSNKKLLPELRDPLVTYLAPDPECKYDPDETMPDTQPLRLPLPDAAADAVVHSRDGELMFVSYLRTYLSHGGFLDLDEQSDRQTIDVLRKGVIDF